MIADLVAFNGVQNLDGTITLTSMHYPGFTYTLGVGEDPNASMKSSFATFVQNDILSRTITEYKSLVPLA
jgi:hypothetical protein